MELYQNGRVICHVDIDAYFNDEVTHHEIDI